MSLSDPNEWSKTEFGKAAFEQQKTAFLAKKKAEKDKKRKRQSEGGKSNSKSKFMSRAEVEAMMAERDNFNMNASKVIAQGFNNFSNCSSNLSAAQKKVTIAEHTSSVLNEIVKLHPGGKGNDEEK